MRVILLVIYILVIVVWAIISLIAMALAWLYSLLFDKERRPVMALSRVVARMVYIFSPLWRVRVEGAEKLDPKQTYVITCNHQSFFDIPLAFFLPLWKFKFVSKVEVRNIPAIGWMLGMRGDIVIRRGTASAAVAVMEQGTEHLKAGTSVFIFPEGTRTKDGNIHRYKDGAFRLAQENGVAIAPCVMLGTKGLFKGRRLNSRRLVIRVLDPIPAEEVKATPARELAERVKEVSVEALSKLRVKSF